MKAIICLPVDFEANQFGLAARLDESIDGAPVLYHAVSRLRLSDDYRVVCMFKDTAALEKARDMLAGLDCDFLHTQAADVPNREFLVRARLWSIDSWRGGMGWTTYWDEAGAPAALAEAMETFDADTVGLITPDSPLADPRLASQMLAWHREHLKKARVTMTGVPPGLAPAFFSGDVVRSFAEAQLTPAASMSYRSEHPQRDLAASQAHFEADMALRTAPWRLTAHSLRQMEMLESLSQLGASPRGASAGEAVAALRSNGRLWAGPIPSRIEIEPTSRFDVAPYYLADYMHAREPVDMDQEVFEKIVQSTAPYRDCLLSLEGLGEPLLHGGIEKMVTAAVRAGVLGVHISTSGLCLDRGRFSALRDAGLDVLSVRTGAATPEGYQRLYGKGQDGFTPATAALKMAFAERRKSEIPAPLLAAEMTKLRRLEDEIEPFYNHWLKNCDWPVIRPYNDFAGQISDHATIHMRTSQRIPCRKIFTELYIDASGTAWPCRQDIMKTRPLGDAAREGLAALWRGDFLEELRAAHLCGDWGFFTPCLACKDWYYHI